MANNAINFKDPLWMTNLLDMALGMEKDKFKACPVPRDVVPDAEVAQGWGYVVAGYFLVEQAFKALLHVQGKPVALKHSLTIPFDGMEPEDRDMLREYYADYKNAVGWSRFPFDTLDEFLANLDGDPNDRESDYLGSFDWRYFPIEEKRGADMPTVSVEFLHEMAYGCIRMVEHASGGNSEPLAWTYSHRLRRKRMDKYRGWLMERMNSGGWEGLPDRWEIYWGPDYKHRYDLRLFKGEGARNFFSEMPEDITLPVEDKREELESLGVDPPHSTARRQECR